MQGQASGARQTAGSSSGKTSLGTTLGAIALAVAIAAVAVNFVVPGPKGPIGPEGLQGTQGIQGTSAQGVWAVVNQNGSLWYGSNVVSSGQQTTGQYYVLFDQNVSACSYVANLGTPYPGGVGVPGWVTVAGLNGSPDGVFVRVTNLAGSATNESFDLGVFCAPGLWAVIDSTGGLVRGSDVVASSHLTTTGQYSIVFNQDVQNCSFVATLGATGSNGAVGPGVATVAGRTGNPDGVLVATYNATGGVTDSSFDVAAVCTSPTWAVIGSSGAAARGSDNGSKAVPGGYSVSFPRYVWNCAYLASPGVTGSSGYAPAGALTLVGTYNDPDAVFVGPWSLSGSENAQSFHLVVLC